MTITAQYHRAIAWAARNERRLGAILFAFGFFTDFFTFGVLPVSIVNVIFQGYLVLAAASALGSHAFAGSTESASWWRRALGVVFPLALQYAFGGLLSGLVVFYGTHSFIAASWPFLIVLLVVYAGNEYFRMYKHYLVFQTSLFFFSLYAYSVFGLPLLVGSLGPWIFLASTALALAAFALFLYVLRAINKARLESEFRLVTYSAAGIVLAVCLSYFSGIIPPIPLAMKDGAIYHTLVRESGGYVVSVESPRAWWDLRTPEIHATSGETLFAYSAVAAPISFSSRVVHRWERDVPGKGWVTESKVSFPISGGRTEGYRGYSEKSGVTAGHWRVSVETPNGQVIGRIRFDVTTATKVPELTQKTL